MTTDKKPLEFLRSIDARLRGIEIKIEALHVQIAGLDGTVDRIETVARDAEAHALHARAGIAEIYRLAVEMPGHEMPPWEPGTEVSSEEKH